MSEEIAAESLEWFHSIRLTPDVVTSGRKSLQTLEREFQALRLPDLHGKTVLDIGAYDGFFSFAAEKAGAERVVSLDHYIWSTDMGAYTKDWKESKTTGAVLPPPHQSKHWDPIGLPGKKPFDLARKYIGSRIEPVVGDFMTMNLDSVGKFDVVLFLGVLYHLENPLEAIKRLFDVTKPGGLVVIETEAMEFLGSGKRAYCEFFPGQELNNDASNWWSPNAKAMEGFCAAAGFREIEVLTSRNLREWGANFYRALRNSTGAYLRELKAGKIAIPVKRYRLFTHARA